MSEERKLIVGVVGPTGSGKTTLVRGLGKRLDYKVYEEKPRDNPYLARFYQQLRSGKRPARAALASQMHYLLEAYGQAQEIEKVIASNGVVWDVPPEGHRMYADLQYRQGILSPRDYEMYCQVFDLCLLTSLQPDLLVVTLAKIEVLQRRIEDRGREEEQGVAQDYWQSQINYWQAKVDEDGGKRMIGANSGELNWLKEDGIDWVWAKILAQANLA